MSTSAAHANCQTDELLSKCNVAVEDCRAALDARNKEIQLCRLGLIQSLDRQGQLNANLEDAQDKLGSPFRNPWLMIALGLVIGVAVTK